MNDPVHGPDRPLVAPDRAPWLQRLRTPVAITGGTGFVGSHLVETLLAAGVTPRVLVRDRAAARWIGGHAVEWFDGDLADRDALRGLVEDAGTVIHLAGVLRAWREDDFLGGNRDGTASLAAAVTEVAPGARLVHVSSQAALGPSPSREGLEPDAALAPISAYGRSKAAAEAEVAAAREVDWTILRPPAIYGPRDTDVFEFFRLAARGLAARPAGERFITVAHVADVVRAALAAAVAADGERRFHVGEPEARTLEDLLAAVASTGGVAARRLAIPRAVFMVAGAAGSAAQALGFPPRRPHPRQGPRNHGQPLVAGHAVESRTPGAGDLGGFRRGCRRRVVVVPDHRLAVVVASASGIG
jgi:nucleoside-diphosphate-sugar epimerase